MRIVQATRTHEQLQIGVSTRGSLALVNAAKATAMVNERDYVVPEDILSNAVPVLAHRVIPRSYNHDQGAHTTQQIIQQVLETVRSPV